MVQAGYDYSRQWEPQTEPAKPQVRRVKKTYTRVNVKRKWFIKLASFTFIFGLILVYLCIKGAVLGYQIVALEQELNDYEALNARLQYNIQESCSLDKVEQIALNQLGMHKPDKHMSMMISTPAITVADNENTGSDQPALSEAEEKPLYKLYTNLLLLAEKN